MRILKVNIFSIVVIILAASISGAQPKTKEKCDKAFQYYKDLGLVPKDKDSRDVVYRSGTLHFSGQGILKITSPISFTCSQKVNGKGEDNLNLFAIGIVLDQRSLVSSISSVKKLLFLNQVESPHKEKLMIFLETRMKDIKPSSFPEWIEEKSGPYTLRLMTTQGDASGSTSLMIHMDYKI